MAQGPPGGGLHVVTARIAVMGATEAREALLSVMDSRLALADSDADAAVIVALEDEEAALASVRECRETGTRNIVLVAPKDLISLRRALDAGADGVVVLDRAAEALAPTVEAVIAGQVVVPQDGRERLERPMLTVREKQTLAMVVLGFSNGEIAQKLFVTESTVKSHLSSSFRKLGVTSRKQAVARILDPDGGLGTGILSITGGELIGPVEES